MNQGLQSEKRERYLCAMPTLLGGQSLRDLKGPAGMAVCEENNAERSYVPLTSNFSSHWGNGLTRFQHCEKPPSRAGSYKCMVDALK